MAYLLRRALQLRPSTHAYVDLAISRRFVIQTGVLIIGSGPAGLTAALALSTYGVSNIVVTEYR
jgi:threonine dehydrogenase-like Zn-dependent dehydrogenase